MKTFLAEKLPAAVGVIVVCFVVLGVFLTNVIRYHTREGEAATAAVSQARTSSAGAGEESTAGHMTLTVTNSAYTQTQTTTSYRYWLENTPSPTTTPTKVPYEPFTFTLKEVYNSREEVEEDSRRLAEAFSTKRDKYLGIYTQEQMWQLEKESGEYSSKLAKIQQIQFPYNESEQREQYVEKFYQSIEFYRDDVIIFGSEKAKTSYSYALKLKKQYEEGKLTIDQAYLLLERGPDESKPTAAALYIKFCYPLKAKYESIEAAKQERTKMAKAFDQYLAKYQTLLTAEQLREQENHYDELYVYLKEIINALY